MQDLRVFLIFLTSSIGCFVLHEWTSFSAVLASSIIGFTISLIPWKKYTKTDVEVVAYAGTFAGMSSSFHMSQIVYFFVSALIATIVFKYSRHYFVGFGGKLGTIAFLSVVVFLL